MDCYLNDYKETEVKEVSDERVEELLVQVPLLWIFAATWSIGTTTNLPGR
jgi:hypothetical protein